MKNLILTAALIIACATPAMAEEVVRQLPGNATIVTNTDRPTPGITINNNESVYYRALFGRERQRDYLNNNSNAMNEVHTQCAEDNRTTSSQNACVRRTMREFEHGIND